MDGQDGLGSGQLGVGELGPQIDGRQRCLPVVAMHNLGVEIYKRHNFKHGAREKCKSFTVVVISVAPGTLEIKLIVDKIERDSVFNI